MAPRNPPFVEAASPFGEGVAILFDPSGDPSALAGSEPFLALPESLLKAAPERQLSFLAGRLCAGRALRAAGASELVVGAGNAAGPDRAPLWPEGWTGSITHTRGGFAAAVVARAGTFVGLDSEEWIDAKTFAEVSGETATPVEIDLVSRALSLTPERALTVIFCAKEALYKALAPRARRFFGFLDAGVVACAHGTLRLRLLIELPFYGAGFECECRISCDADRAHALVAKN